MHKMEKVFRELQIYVRTTSQQFAKEKSFCGKIENFPLNSIDLTSSYNSLDFVKFLLNN